jgi:hypothetical protein
VVSERTGSVGVVGAAVVEDITGWETGKRVVKAGVVRCWSSTWTLEFIV